MQRSYGCCYLGREIAKAQDWHCDTCRKYIHFVCEREPASKDGGRKTCRGCVDELLAEAPERKSRRKQ